MSGKPAPIDISPEFEQEGTLKIETKIIRGKKQAYLARWRVPPNLRKHPRSIYKWKALEADNLTDAKKEAYQWWKELSVKVNYGDAIDVPHFKKVAADYLTHLEKQAQTFQNDKPLLSKEDLKRYKSIITRYLIPFFGEYRIDQIPNTMLASYEHWRRNYYLTGPGKDEEDIVYRRNGKTLIRPAVKSYDLPHSTIHKDKIAFNKIIDHARRVKKVHFQSIPKIELSRRKLQELSQRPHFEEDELELLFQGLADRRANIKNSSTKYARTVLMCFCGFLLHSGLRVAEAYQLKIGHLQKTDLMNIPRFRQEYEARKKRILAGEYVFLTDKQKDKFLANEDRDGLAFVESFHEKVIADIDAETPEMKEKIINRLLKPKQFYRIQVSKSKDVTHVRHVFPEQEIGKYLNVLFFNYMTFLDESIIGDAKKMGEFPMEMPLWVSPEGEAYKRLDHGFTTALEEIQNAQYSDGLLHNLDGKRRSLTSFRHTYATRMLRDKGINIYDLASQMGTSVEMIEKHYSHVLNEQKADHFIF